ncbi:MAG: hypothetical protein AMJ53_17305, partial [Gammaproteobacteria bacterium SG8_11]
MRGIKLKFRLAWNSLIANIKDRIAIPNNRILSIGQHKHWMGAKVVQTGGVQASALIGTVKTGIITSTAYRTLVYLPLILLLAGCEFDSGNPGIVVSPTSGLVTKENGEPAHFTIVLNSKPDAMVTIAMSSSDPSEGEVKDKISFSASNWSTPQTVAVSGVDDNEMDGNIAYSINFQPSQSGDQRYNNLSLAAVSVVNQDDETTDQPKPNTRVTLTPPSGLVTSENLITDNFTVVLNSQPTNAVTIALTSSNTSEGTVSPANLTFTTSNWNLAQIVTVSGVDDNLKDGDTDYSIDFAVQSADNNFNNLTLTPVSVVNLDNDSAGVTVTPTMLLTTSEAQSSVSFSVVLNGQPASNVIISASSSDTSEGTVSPPSITFTPNNWSTAMQFVVTGVDDSLVDGTVAYSISLTAQSNDQNYNGINIPAVQLQNSDNDSTVPPSPNPAIITSPNSGLVTTETGTSASFTVVLTSAPISDVTVNVISSDTTEGLATPGSLTFTPNNWSSVQSVTVTGVDDPDADGDINYSIGFSVISSDIDYNGMTVTPVTAVNQNNDRAAITLSPASGLITSEDLDQDSFTVMLTSRPSSTATILLSSSDTSEGTVSPASLTFTTSNWNLPQTVNITGVNDSLVDGNVNYSINISVQSTDTNYNNMTVTPITAVNQDNDSAPPAGVAINPRSGLQTSEDLATDTFTIALTSQPASTVTIGLTSSDTTEGTVSPSSVSFSTTNWNSAQPVTVTGVNDTLVDGDINYSINFTVQSTDSNYNGLGVTPVSITNVDNESTSQAGITITPASGLQTSENLTSATFRLVLDSQPSNTVTISMSSSDTSEGTVSPSTVTFTTANWGTARTVAVTGVNDALVDGNVNYSIFFTVQSIDGNYNGMALTPVTVVNLDNDSAPAAGVTITPT